MSLVGEIGKGYKYFSKRIKGYHLEYLNIHTGSASESCVLGTAFFCF
jgi:hypothetical protein